MINCLMADFNLEIFHQISGISNTLTIRVFTAILCLICIFSESRDADETKGDLVVAFKSILDK